MNRLLRLNRRERILAIATLSVLAAGTLYVQAVEPMVVEWSTARSRAHTLDEERNRLLSLMDHREEIETRFAKLQGAIAEGNSIEELEHEFVQDVEALARREGLQISNIRPLGHADEAPFHRLSVQITTEGEHHEFVRFLRAMQRPGTLLRGDAITVAASRRTPPLTITLRISKLVRVYRS